jgi:hypothetical protein
MANAETRRTTVLIEDSNAGFDRVSDAELSFTRVVDGPRRGEMASVARAAFENGAWRR